VFNVAAVAQNFEKVYREHSRLMIYRIDLDDLSGNMEAVVDMIDFFNLTYDRVGFSYGDKWRENE